MKITAKVVSLILLLVLTFIANGYSGQKILINKIGYTNSGKIYIEVPKKSKFKAFTLKKPDRIVIDVFGATSKYIKKSKYIKNVKSVRFSDHNDKARIVLDLKSSLKILATNYIKSDDGRSGKIMIITSASKGDVKKQKVVPSAVSGKKRVKRKSKPVIVIDAGHGGRDPGAIGRRLRTKEKVITLSYAKLLYSSLKRSGKYKVYMTRNNDKYVSLRARVEKARKVRADLFISIHANSSRSRKPKGFSVYTLSEKASDKEAEKLARKENKSEAIKGMSFKNVNKDIYKTLIDLSQRSSMNFSSKFANLAINKVERQGVHMIHNTHRFAGFLVLTAPDMVSVLIELGYLSNRSEEKQLNAINHKRKIVRGIKKAIDEYFKFKKL